MKGRMMKRVTILGLWLLLATGITRYLVGAQQEDQSESIELALEIAKAQGKMVLIDFFSPG